MPVSTGRIWEPEGSKPRRLAPREEQSQGDKRLAGGRAGRVGWEGGVPSEMEQTPVSLVHTIAPF